MARHDVATNGDTARKNACATARATRVEFPACRALPGEAVQDISGDALDGFV